MTTSQIKIKIAEKISELDQKIAEAMELIINGQTDFGFKYYDDYRVYKHVKMSLNNLLHSETIFKALDNGDREIVEKVITNEYLKILKMESNPSSGTFGLVTEISNRRHRVLYYEFIIDLFDIKTCFIKS